MPGPAGDAQQRGAVIPQPSRKSYRKSTRKNKRK